MPAVKKKWKPYENGPGKTDSYFSCVTALDEAFFGLIPKYYRNLSSIAKNHSEDSNKE